MNNEYKDQVDNKKKKVTNNINVMFTEKCNVQLNSRSYMNKCIYVYIYIYNIMYTKKIRLYAHKKKIPSFFQNNENDFNNDDGCGDDV